MRMILLSCLVLFLNGAAFAESSTLLLFTARADGRLENCHCPSDPNGAIEKRLPEIERFRELGPVVLMDAGGFFPKTIDTLSIPFIVQAHELHGYDAVTLGAQELSFGPRWVKMTEQSLPVVSANLNYRDGTPIGERVRVVERGGETYAITGITSRESLRILGPKVYEDFSLLDVDEALELAFANVPLDARKIVLAQVPVDQIRQTPEWWEGIDLVVGGFNSDLLKEPARLQNTTLMQIGSKSRYIGIARFRGTRLKAELHPIKLHLPDDPRIIELSMELRKQRVRLRPEQHRY